jgi:hypothetical protein
MDGFFVFRDCVRVVEQVGAGVMTVNGHITYVPGTNNEWILNDTYPQGRVRFQMSYLYQAPSNRRVNLGKFHSPVAYTGEWRATHSRAVATTAGSSRSTHLTPAKAASFMHSM